MDLTESSIESASRHPWERARASFFLSLLRGALAGREEAKILDLGSGDAYFADVVSRGVPRARVTCVDIGYDASTAARLRRLYPNLEFASEAPPRRSFDAVLALDVIEHVANDLALLQETVRNAMAPGGVVVISVPAHRWLWSSHDVALRHHRRYAHRELGRLVTRAGLTLDREGGAFASLVLPRALAVACERNRPSPPVRASDGAISWGGGSSLAHVLTLAMRLDATICRGAANLGIVVPGLSYWALATKPEEAP